MSTVYCGCDKEASHMCERHTNELLHPIAAEIGFAPVNNIPGSPGHPQGRTFVTGATRDSDTSKPDYEGFLSPLVIERFGAYMHKNRYQVDGKLRDADNWQKGIPQVAYIKSGWRHFFDWWKLHRAASVSALTPVGEQLMEEALCALMFNVMGYLHEHLKVKR